MGTPNPDRAEARRRHSVQNISSKLDWTRMLGFEQIAESRVNGQGNRKLGAKVGSKLGGKIGLKAGLKT